MKTIELVIKGLPPCPRNRSHVAMVRKIGGKSVAHVMKTEAARAYEQAIKKHLKTLKEKIKEFAKDFDKMKHGLEAKWMFYTPDFYTKEGKISENSVDLDAHKVLQDTIMELVGIDDAYIMTEARGKFAGEDHSYAVRLTIVDNRTGEYV